MPDQPVADALQHVLACALPEGGFGGAIGASFRPDATAWAILALRALGEQPALVRRARERLAAAQGNDGRVSIAAAHPEAWWPTPLAILAWQGSAGFEQAGARAVSFLLGSSGEHWQEDPGEPVAHNTAIRGWSWVSKTHSWVEPTSLALLALSAVGAGVHARAGEGARMLLDRQLPGGGWNYGNKVVFDQELRPMAESTGMALDALGGRVPRESVQAGLDYVQQRLAVVRSPLSLGWGLLGLGAWDARPQEAPTLIAECLARQEWLGAYDTALLGLLIVAAGARAGLQSVLGALGTSL